MHYPAHLLKLMELLKQLPGVGTKSAERYAFDMLDWSSSQLEATGKAIATLKANITRCDACGCLKNDQRCPFCEDATRDRTLLCVIASPRDAFAMEKTREFRGIYHVLGGLLSPMEGRGPDTLALPQLMRRIQQFQVQELVIALDSTLEGDATALYLKQELEPHSLRISRLAFGLPMGSSIDYVDGDTLARALSGRRQF